MKLEIMSTAVAALALLAASGLARADGELNIYNWGNYTNPDVIKKFEEKYNVKVTITDYDSNDTALAKVRQGGSGFDIAVPSQTHLPIWISEGLLLETNPDGMENFKNVAPEWADPEFDPGRKYSVPWAVGNRRHRRQHRLLQGRHQHLEDHLRHARRAEGQGQRRAGDEGRGHRRRPLCRRRAVHDRQGSAEEGARPAGCRQAQLGRHGIWRRRQDEGRRLHGLEHLERRGACASGWHGPK